MGYDYDHHQYSKMLIIVLVSYNSRTNQKQRGCDSREDPRNIRGQGQQNIQVAKRCQVTKKNLYWRFPQMEVPQ